MTDRLAGWRGAQLLAIPLSGLSGRNQRVGTELFVGPTMSNH
jgi:hypothetical protein